MEKKGRDKYQRSRNKEHGLAMQSREKNKLLFALSIRLTYCKTLCSGSLCSVERRGGMWLSVFIDQKCLFCVGFIYHGSSEDSQSSSKT